MPEIADKLTAELESFRGVWKGGYFEGDPRDPLARSTYSQMGYMSVLYATYLCCIKPYIRPDTVALEIGPGRGAWTKTMLAAREVWVMDALSAEHNGFWEYVGRGKNVRYLHVSDFECRDLPDDHFSYMFSFGCLCHVSPDGIEQYARNLWPKLKEGADCFWLVADYEQFNRWLASRPKLNIWERLVPKVAKYAPVNALLRAIGAMEWRRAEQPKKDSAEDAQPRAGRWYDAGRDRTCAMLEAVGYTIVDPDVGTTIRDPIIHFRK